MSAETTTEEVEPTDEVELTEEEFKSEMTKVFDELVKKGIIVPNKDAPDCMGCQKPLENINVKTIWIIGEEAEIDSQDFEWFSGMHQFMVSPSFFGFVKDDMARFEASCSLCGMMVPDIVIVEDPHGLKFGDASRMAGNL